MLLSSFLYIITISAQNTDSIFLEAAIAKLRSSKDYTLQVAKLMPERNFSYRPEVDEMSFGDQLLHISGNMKWLCLRYLNGSKSVFLPTDVNPLNKNEVIQVLTKTYDFAINVIEQFDAKQLQDTVSFFAGPINKLRIISLLNDHQTHHRGQLIVYLRLNGIKPPDYVGW